MSEINDFNNLALSLTELFKALIIIEKNKLKAVTSNNLDVLDSCIKEEQVEIMKLKGLEKKREQLLTSLGYKNFTFKQIISFLNKEDKKEAQALFDDLKKAISDFRAISSSVKTAIEINLHIIESAIEKSPVEQKQGLKANKSFANKFA